MSLVDAASIVAGPERPSGPDLNVAPVVVAWEVTRACGYACVHCRADAQPWRSTNELLAEEGRRLVAQLALFPRPPILVLTGGDPLLRKDLEGLVEDATVRGLTTALTPSATPKVTPARLRALADAGVRRIALSLDGASADTHDGVRQLPGSFKRTLRILSAARDAGIPTQVNSTVMRRNRSEMDRLAELVARLDPAMWSVFFLVPVGRADATQVLSPTEHEAMFEYLADVSDGVPFRLKVTEAPPYRRVLLQRAARGGPRVSPADLAPVRDGKGFMFVSHEGDVCPSGFLPLPAGNVRRQNPVAIYQDAPLFRALRDDDLLKGKCGRCPFRRVCGGSRARAWAMRGDPLGQDPTCAFVPAAAPC
jgi:AdoMet-dependent heme synthase